MMRIAFVLLCLSQMLHFTKHWCLLTRRLMEEANDRRVRKAVDWKQP